MNTTNFKLIETILWENNAYFLLDFHMNRLASSADHFNFSFDKPSILKSLEKKTSGFDKSQKYRVRLLLDAEGVLTVTSQDINSKTVIPSKIALSQFRTDKNDIFFYHKTTNRELYNREHGKYKEQGFFDVIFMNQDNEVTEGAITNIVIQKDGIYYTPPVSSGLLAGTYRRFLQKSQDVDLKEKVLYYEDLLNADKIYLTNSVVKMLEATLIP